MERTAVLGGPTAIGLLLLAALTACAGGEDAVATPEISKEDIYLETVRDMVTGMDDVPDEIILQLGESICGAVKEGVDDVAILAAGLDSGFTARETGAIRGAAVAALCPEVDR